MSNFSDPDFNRGNNILGFSGADAKAYISIPAYEGHDAVAGFYQLGTLQTISISTYASKVPTKALGRKDPTGIGRGTRTYAGTLIFNQLNDNVLNNNWDLRKPNREGLVKAMSGSRVAGHKAKKHEWDFSWDNGLVGEIVAPNEVIPFDIVIPLVNETNNKGIIVIKDVDLTHDGQTLSIEDIYIEQQYQYIARSVQHFKSVDDYQYTIKQNYLNLNPSIFGNKMIKPTNLSDF